MKKDVKNVMGAATPNANMAIYTKTGDNGTTSILGGKRFNKSDPQVEAYGSIDELTSFIGLVVTKLKDREQEELLIRIQKDLYLVMSFLACKNIALDPLNIEINKIEQTIDRIQSKLTKLNNFILPGGTELSAWFHILRTICRRAERRTVGYVLKLDNYSKYRIIIQYLNRLSDLFFILARKYNEK